MMQNAQNKSWKWFMVSGRSMTDRQMDWQTDELHVEMTREGLAHTRANNFILLCSCLLAVHVCVCVCVCVCVSPCVWIGLISPNKDPFVSFRLSTQ